MDFVVVFFAVAVAWFTFICLRIAVFIYQFLIFPKTFGQTTNVSLQDLSDLADSHDEDLPGFKIVIPAYQESLVIDGTLRKLADLNYPRTHFDVLVVTYEDEPVEPGSESTFDVAKRVEAEINGEAGRQLIKILSVPAGFDGNFPGNLKAKDRFIGKPRGLNFALRRIHEDTEIDERSFYVGKMARLGHLDALEKALVETDAALHNSPQALEAAATRYFDPNSPDFVGRCVLSTQLWHAFEVLNNASKDSGGDTPAERLIAAYIAQQAPQFFLTFAQRNKSQTSDAFAKLSVMEDRRFLYYTMRAVEAEGRRKLQAASIRIEARLEQERPILKAAIDKATDGAEVYQLARRINSRWMAAYDADADVPAELFRHLGARILTTPDVMGFQGPVSPVANYEAVHPLCKLGGLWMGFWHSTGYPRLMSKPKWAHVLAGTNWCFRIDGIKSDGRLVTSAPYDEAKRRFILTFDPRQLTEDLEVAVRVFDKWKVNAEWHPFVEFEQVPATPKAMVAQRRRWTLGTLQTIAYMTRSNLPMAQKLKYSLLPLDIVVSGTGPIVTVALWILIYTGGLISSPILIAWSIFLTFGNVVYVLPYLLAHERFVLGFRRAAGADYLTKQGRSLSQEIVKHLSNGEISKKDAAVLRDISTLLQAGQKPNGFITRYQKERSLDEGLGSGNAMRLGQNTPTALFRNDLPELAGTYARLVDQSYVAISAQADAAPDLSRKLAALKNAVEKAGATGPWRIQRRKERRQIWLWALVYLFYQLIPYYSGLFHWLSFRKETDWVKTPRTRKSNLPMGE